MSTPSSPTTDAAIPWCELSPKGELADAARAYTKQAMRLQPASEGEATAGLDTDLAWCKAVV